MFLGFSRGSCCKSKAQLLRTYNRQHISEEAYQDLNKKAQDLIDQLSNIINYLKNSERKGSKCD